MLHGEAVMRSRLACAAFTALAALSAVACSSSASSSDPASSDSAFTNARPDASADAVAPYTDADQPAAYAARVRVAFGTGAASEHVTTAAFGSEPDVPLPWSLGVAASPAGRSVYLVFGATNAKKFDVGTYSCADGDADIFEAEWNPDGTAKPAREAGTCSVVIDAIEPGPSAHYARAYGRFTATANAPDGLSVDLNGAFLADFPIGK